MSITGSTEGAFDAIHFRLGYAAFGHGFAAGTVPSCSCSDGHAACVLDYRMSHMKALLYTDCALRNSTRPLFFATDNVKLKQVISARHNFSALPLLPGESVPAREAYWERVRTVGDATAIVNPVWRHNSAFSDDSVDLIFLELALLAHAQTLYATGWTNFVAVARAWAGPLREERSVGNKCRGLHKTHLTPIKGTPGKSGFGTFLHEAPWESTRTPRRRISNR